MRPNAAAVYEVGHGRAGTSPLFYGVRIGDAPTRRAFCKRIAIPNRCFSRVQRAEKRLEAFIHCVSMTDVERSGR